MWLSWITQRLSTSDSGKSHFLSGAAESQAASFLRIRFQNPNHVSLLFELANNMCFEHESEILNSGPKPVKLKILAL